MDIRQATFQFRDARCHLLWGQVAACFVGHGLILAFLKAVLIKYSEVAACELYSTPRAARKLNGQIVQCPTLDALRTPADPETGLRLTAAIV